MASTAQKAIFTAKLSGILKELMVKTSADQVYLDDTTTLDTKLQEIIDALNGKAPKIHNHETSDITGLDDALTARPTTESMNTAISAAISELINGAPETYDTLKEVADYISSHEDVVSALNDAIGSKAEASTVTALQATVEAINTTVNSLGAMATKDSVSETDLDDALKTKINNILEKAHTHANADALDSINSTMIADWNEKSKIHYSASEPENLKDGDMWVQLVN